MKNKIFYKFLGAFVLVILLFSLTLGSVFFFLFRNHTIEINRASMEQKAVSIAKSLSEEYLSGEQEIPSDKQGSQKGKQSSQMGNRPGSRGYLAHLDKIAMAEVWIADAEKNIYTLGSNRSLQYSELPENAGSVLAQVFEGKTTYGEEFSEPLGAASLTVGAPIYSGTDVIGAVLLHSPVSWIDTAVRYGLTAVAVGCLVGLVLAGIAAAALSYRLTEPLQKMRKTALALADGDYEANTGISSKDEVGQLANTMDVLAKRLEEARNERKEIDKMRDSFVANVSHELRTPIAILRGYIELLADGTVKDDKEVQDSYRQMLAESRHMERLVNDLLELSRLQDGGFYLTMENVNLCDAAADAARAIRRQAQEKGISVESELPDSDCVVRGDYGRIRQMLIILMDNAVKFSHEGGSIQLAVTENPNPTLRVTDHGVGISKEELPYIFERFHKSNSAENQKGSGLGLAIAKEIAKRHDAEIGVQSEKGSTVFEISFPTAESGEL